MVKLAGLGVVLLLLAGTAAAQTAPGKPVPVGVVTASLQPVTRAQEFAGRIEATERVDVRARVTGYLEEVLFKEGDTVKAGAPLYRIEKAPFEAAVLEARGALLQAQGTY